MEVKEIDSFITAYQLRDIAQSLTNIASKNWFWDIVVPIGIAALVAVISSILTYFYTRRANNALLNQQQAHFNQNQLIARENSKRESINEFNLLINSCLTTLICIKDQYRRPFPNLLLQRILHIPVIKSMKFEDIEYKELLSRLTFITPVGEEKVTKWNQVTQIEGLLYQGNRMSAH